MLDREFFDARVIKVLANAGVTYLVPCSGHGYAREARGSLLRAGASASRMP